MQEMDYNLEASNTITFKKQMASLQGIMVPTVHPEFTSRRVIVSDWIEGEKLADSKASDVRALCSTLLNCYLIQLLETGLLHADPHPGEQRALCCSVGGQRRSWGSPPAAQGRTLEREVLQAAALAHVAALAALHALLRCHTKPSLTVAPRLHLLRR